MRETHTTKHQADLYVPTGHPVIGKRVGIVRKHAACTIRRIDVHAPYAAALADLSTSAAGIDDLHHDFLAGTDMQGDHLLYFVLEGDAWAISGKWRKRIRKGDLLMAARGEALWVELKAGHCKAAWFHVLDVEHWSDLKKRPLSVQKALNADAIGQALERMIEEGQSGSYDAKQVAMHYARLVALYLERETVDIHEPHERLERHRLFTLWDEVNTSLEKNWTVVELAARMHVSPGHLHRIVRKHHCATPMEMLTRFRMERAKHLLKSATLTLDQIASALNYSTAYAFSAAFKRYTNLRPGAFRTGEI